MTRAAAYLRISKDDEGQGLGIDRQYDLVRALCADKGWTLDPQWVIRENNTSAWDDTKPRPGFQRLLRGIESGQVHAVAVYAFDRLTRRLSDTARVLDLVEKRGVQIATVTGGLDLSTIYGRGLAGILGSMASMEIASLRERLTAKAEQNARSGKVTNGGRRPYGYDVRRRSLVPEEAEWIRYMARHLLGGGSMTALCRELNERGVLTSYGKRWDVRKLRDVLDNPRLCGWVVYKGEIVRDDHGQPVRAEAEAVLSVEEFQRLQVAMAARARTENRWTNERAHLLAGSLLRCGVCDGKTVAFKQTSGVWAYRCRGHVFRDEKNVDAHVRRDVIAYALENPIRVSEWQTEEEADLTAEVAGLERRRTEAVRAFAEHGGDAGSLALLTNQIGQQIADLQSRQVEQVLIDTEIEWAQFDPTRVLAAPARDGAELEQQRATISLYVDRILLHQSKQRGRGYDGSATEIVFRDPNRLRWVGVIERT